MKKIKLTVPAIITKFEEHTLIKDSVLKLIREQDSAERIYEEGTSTLDITRCDYKESYDPRPWTDVMQPHLLKALTSIYSELGYASYSIHNIWFQQYNTGSTHGWHVHTKCQWTNVYYLDLPDGTPKTELIDPWSREVITMDVQEGDILTFPSFVIHRAPVNKTATPKTIISFNSDTEIDGATY